MLRSKSIVDFRYHLPRIRSSPLFSPCIGADCMRILISNFQYIHHCMHCAISMFIYRRLNNPSIWCVSFHFLFHLPHISSRIILLNKKLQHLFRCCFAVISFIHITILFILLLIEMATTTICWNTCKTHIKHDVLLSLIHWWNCPPCSLVPPVPLVPPVYPSSHPPDPIISPSVVAMRRVGVVRLFLLLFSLAVILYRGT